MGWELDGRCKWVPDEGWGAGSVGGWLGVVQRCVCEERAVQVSDRSLMFIRFVVDLFSEEKPPAMLNSLRISLRGHSKRHWSSGLIASPITK